MLYYILSSKISYGAECNIEDFVDEYALCAELGTTFYIIGTVFTILTMIIYELSYAVYATHTWSQSNAKVMAEPTKLKGDFSTDFIISNQDNTADRTSSDIKHGPDELFTDIASNTISSTLAEECYQCKKLFLYNELGVTEGIHKFHFKCYIGSK